MDVDVEEIDEAWKEEEQLVVVHLSGIIDADYLKKCDPSNCKILGIDTDEPAMQIDQMVFTGNYKESIGSNIMFEEKESTAADGELLTDFKYMSHTTKTLEMNRVFLKGIQTESRDTNSGEVLNDVQTGFVDLNENDMNGENDEEKHEINDNVIT